MNDRKNARVGRAPALAVALAALLATAELAAAKTQPPSPSATPSPPAAKKSLSDSPYSNGAPPITGGFTDTSQGGTRTSGDPMAAPPGVAPAKPAVK